VPGLKEMEVRVERFETLRALYTYAFSDTPEEDAEKEIMKMAKTSGLLEKTTEARMFGRNVYPTDKPEPHGYEFYLTVPDEIKPEGDHKMKELPSGLYAVLRFKNLIRIREAWEKIWRWIEESSYEHVGWKKSEHGWVGGFEERIDWQEERPHTEWTFDLWVQLKE
jgi:DNA gyrase inhibitor GyrI